MNDARRYLDKQKSFQLADKAISKAAGKKHNTQRSYLAYLVTSFAQRDNFPSDATLIKMAPKVVQSLESLGLLEPVSMSLLQGKWWIADVDASALNPNLSIGGGAVEITANSEDLISRYWDVYCEVKEGPFDSKTKADCASKRKSHS